VVAKVELLAPAATRLSMPLRNKVWQLSATDDDAVIEVGTTDGAGYD
jgi:hypothetical protein